MAARLKVSFAHAAGAGDLAFSPNGKHLVTCGADTHIKVMDGGAKDMASAKVVEGNASALSAVAIQSDGEVLAVGTEKEVKMYSFPGMTHPDVVLKTTLPVSDLSFSASGVYLAAATGESEVTLINTIDTSQVVKLRGHDGGVRSVAFDPKNEMLVSCGSDRSVIVWSLDERTARRSFYNFLDRQAMSDSTRCRAQWHPDGDLLALPGAREVRLMARDSLDVASTLYEDGHSDMVDIVAWSPNGLYLATAGLDMQILVWDVRNRETIQRYRHEAEIMALQWHPRANALAVLDAEGQLAVCRGVVPDHMVGPTADPASAPPTQRSAAAAKASGGEAGKAATATAATAATASTAAAAAGSRGDGVEADVALLATVGSALDEEEAEPAAAARSRAAPTPRSAVKRGRRRLQSRVAAGRDDGAGGTSVTAIKAQYGLLRDSDLDDEDADDDEFISDDEGGRGRSRAGGAGGAGGRSGAGQGWADTTALQPAVHPGSTPAGFKRRYLSWNSTGVVVTRDEDTYNSVEIEFSDASQHRSLRFSDHYGFTMAALGDHGVFFAAPSRSSADPKAGPDASADAGASASELDRKGRAKDGDRVPSTLFYRPFTGWAHNSDWIMPLPQDEEAVAVAVGRKWAAVATSEQYVRIFRFSGLQQTVLSLPGPAVAMVGHGPLLAVLFHAGPAFGGRQQLGYELLNVEAVESEGGHATVTAVGSKLAEGRLPLRVGAELTWAGFSDRGMLAVQDSRGLVQGLVPHLGWQWSPLLDTTSKACGKTAGAMHWVVGIKDSKLMCVVCRGEQPFPATYPRPVLSAVPLVMPFLQLDGSQGRLQEGYARQLLQLRVLHAMPDGTAPAALEDDVDAATQRAYAQLDKATLTLLQAACVSDRSNRALDLCTRLQLTKSLQIAIAIAQRNKRTALAERIQILLQARMMEGEDVEEQEAEPELEMLTPAKRAHRGPGGARDAADRPMSPPRLGRAAHVPRGGRESTLSDEDGDTAAGAAQPAKASTPPDRGVPCSSSSLALKTPAAQQRRVTKRRTPDSTSKPVGVADGEEEEEEEEGIAPGEKQPLISNLFAKRPQSASTPAAKANPFSRAKRLETAASPSKRQRQEGQPALRRDSSFAIKARTEHQKVVDRLMG